MREEKGGWKGAEDDARHLFIRGERKRKFVVDIKWSFSLSKKIMYVIILKRYLDALENRPRPSTFSSVSLAVYDLAKVPLPYNSNSETPPYRRGEGKEGGVVCFKKSRNNNTTRVA